MKRDLRRIIAMVGLAAFTSMADAPAQAAERIEGLRFKFEAQREQLDKPLEELRAMYREKAAELAKTYSATGDLTKTLAARSAADAESEEPTLESIRDQPKELAQLGRVFITQKALRERERDKASIALQQRFAKGLRVLQKELAAAGDAVAADDIKLEAEKVEAGLARTDRALLIGRGDFEMTGKFHSYIDDTCSFYINGEKVFWHGHYGGSWSPLAKLKVGDCVVFSVHDYGNEKWFRSCFISTTGDEIDEMPFVVSFRAADMREISDDDKRRKFTREEYDAMETRPVKQGNDWDASTPVPNRSEWIWGEGHNVAMVTFVTEEMIEVGVPKEEE